MAAIEWLLFDLGNVLVEVDQSRIFDELALYTGRDSETVRNAIMAVEGFWDPMITKEHTPRQVTEAVNTVLGVTLSEEQVVRALNAELGATISTTAAMLPELRRRMKVGCLSNTNSIHWDALLSSYEFMRLFDRRFASQLLGSAKPSSSIYEKVEGLLAVAPRQIVFFDDKAENIDAARALGWNARIYRDHAGLLQDLEEFEIL